MARTQPTLKTMDPDNLNPCAVADNLHRAIKAAAGVMFSARNARRFIAGELGPGELNASQIKQVLEPVWDALDEADKHGW